MSLGEMFVKWTPNKHMALYEQSEDVRDFVKAVNGKNSRIPFL